MGGVLAAQPGSYPGQTIGGSLATANTVGTIGSGDVGQNLLPVAMKIAAQTIGLDLVAVKPTPGPKIDLLYIDFQYDATRLGDADERPQVFKLNATNIAAVNSIITANIPSYITQTQGGLSGGRLWFKGINATGVTASAVLTSEPTQKTNVVEFLGFSRIDGFPMFRAYRQSNTAGTQQPYGVQQNAWGFDTLRNTFSATASMTSQFSFIVSTAVSGGTIELVSALEDHIPGFSANWFGPTSSASGAYPMDRANDDDSYSGVIGPKISSKTVAVGTIEVSSALRRTEIEDIKANTGMDIVQKMESILVNELSQTISKQIVNKIFEMGSLNRTNAPVAGATFSNAITLAYGSQTIFDLDTTYAATNGVVGGETTHAVQRKLITKIAHASNYIATEGRVGPAQYLITNGGLAAALQDIAGYTINPLKSKMNSQGQLYPVGSIGDISIYVDPYMRYNDNRIVLGRKNNPDQPGIIFVPYLMAQSISIISEATFAPRMLLRSRYAVTEVGWYPQKQFMTIVVSDTRGLLN
jgi:hypothetical protein